MSQYRLNLCFMLPSSHNAVSILAVETVFVTGPCPDGSGQRCVHDLFYVPSLMQPTPECFVTDPCYFCQLAYGSFFSFPHYQLIFPDWLDAFLIRKLLPDLTVVYRSVLDPGLSCPVLHVHSLAVRCYRSLYKPRCHDSSTPLSPGS